MSLFSMIKKYVSTVAPSFFNPLINKGSSQGKRNIEAEAKA